MNSPDERFDRLEEFLVDNEGDEKVEVTRQLRLQGVDAIQFFNRVKKTVQDGYCSQLRAIAHQQQNRQANWPAFLEHLRTMPRSAMLEVFRQLKNGAFGEEYREAALARCRKKDEAALSDDELRTWLEDVGEIWGEPPHGYQ